VRRPDEEIAYRKRLAAAEAARAKGSDDIAFKKEHFQRQADLAKLPAASISAFITTSKFETKSDTSPVDATVLRTFQRLETFKSKLSEEGASESLALWTSPERVADLVHAGTRIPHSALHPPIEIGLEPELEGASRELSKAVAAQYRSQKGNVSHRQPQFLKDRVQADERRLEQEKGPNALRVKLKSHMRKHGQKPVSLIEEAAANGSKKKGKKAEANGAEANGHAADGAEAGALVVAEGEGGKGLSSRFASLVPFWRGKDKGAANGAVGKDEDGDTIANV
jgi:hypothetical protein